MIKPLCLFGLIVFVLVACATSSVLVPGNSNECISMSKVAPQPTAPGSSP
jgi:hypothetical protein